ncbi:MAG: transporter substrate-binding domain-containing protein [Oceanospirillaceae bacterium]
MTKKIFLLLIFCKISQATELSVASIDWCPQVCANSNMAGYITDTAEMVFKDSPYKLNIQTYPWSRSIKLVEFGEKHALLSPAKKEAPSLIFPRNEIGIQRMCFFKLASSSWEFNGLESLKGLRIGIASHTSIEELSDYADKNRHQFHYMPYHKNYIEQSLKKLKLNRLDTFLFTYNSTVFEMKEKGVFSNYKAAGCVSQAKVYLAFSPHPDLNTGPMISYFDKRMDELRATDAISNILKKYDLNDWQEYSNKSN